MFSAALHTVLILVATWYSVRRLLQSEYRTYIKAINLPQSKKLLYSQFTHTRHHKEDVCY